jgi:cytochrome c biogenesis factor
MDERSETVGEENHALPPAFVGTLFAALLGALVPGIYMTLVSAPGQTGSPVYGLLLPWSMLPFLLAVTSGWLARRLPEAQAVRLWTIIAAVLGLFAYTYYMLLHPRGVRNIQVFLFLPLWQWLMLSRALLRALLAARRAG